LFLIAVLSMGLAGCSVSHNKAPENSKPAKQQSGGDIKQLFSTTWRANDLVSRSAPGSILIFLPNGTLLEGSCVETYRIATWTIEKRTPPILRVVEDHQLAFTAEIVELTSNSLRLQQRLVRSRENRNLILQAVHGEFVCPDLPK
jgi:hypothetical protein